MAYSDTVGPSHMDELDTRILRELTQATGVFPARAGFRASNRAIARALHVSPGTVRNRIHRMSAAGVLTGSSVYANPNLLGLESAAYAVEVSPGRKKGEVVDRLRGLEEIYFIQNFRGNFLGLAFVFSDEPSRAKTVEEIHQITGARGGVFSRVHHPPCSVGLAPPEWRVLSRLTRGSFSTYAALARELGASTRTIKRRVAKLVRSRAILSVPTLNYRALSGCVPVDLVVAFTSPAARHEAERKILALVGNRMIFAGMWSDFGLFSLLLPSVSTATRLADEVPRVPGVRTALVEIVEDHIDQVGALHRYVDRRWTASQVPESGPKRSVN